MLKICLLSASDTLNISLYDINYFSIVFPLFPNVNLANINTNISILIFLFMIPPQNLILASDVPVRINMACNTFFVRITRY